MFRLMGTIYKDTHVVKSTVICDETDMNRTKKVFHCLDAICYEFDLEKPLWLDVNIKDFQKHAKARFNQDNFIEVLDFDYLEIQVMKRDEKNSPPGSSRAGLSFLTVFSVTLLFCPRIPVFQGVRTCSSCSSQHPAD